MPDTTEARQQTTAIDGTTKVPADEARAALGDLLDRAGFRGEHISITRHTKPVAVLISVEEYERLVNAAA